MSRESAYYERVTPCAGAGVATLERQTKAAFRSEKNIMPNSFAMPVSEITAAIRSISARGRPARLLRFRLALANRNDASVVLLHSEIRITLGNWVVGEGDLLRYSPARAGLAVIEPGEDSMPAELLVPISLESLAWVEDYRLGEDLPYEANISVRVATVSVDGMVMSPRDVFVMGQSRDVPIRDIIPQSEWVKLLRQLEYSETLLVELAGYPTAARFPAARKRLDEAFDHFRRGHWWETMAACRLVLEQLALVKKPAAAQADMAALREFCGPGVLGDRLDSYMMAVSQLLHTGRHELTDGRTLHPQDARLALTATAELLRYCESSGP